MTDSFRFHLFGQVHLEQPSVPSVCSEDGVRNIAEQRNQTQAEVEHDVEHHPRSESRRQATVDLLTRFDHHQGHETVDEVADDRDDANDTTPTEANTAAVEQRHVETVGPSANLFEDLGVILGEPSRESAFASLGFACWLSALVIDGDFLFEGIRGVDVLLGCVHEGSFGQSLANERCHLECE